MKKILNHPMKNCNNSNKLQIYSNNYFKSNKNNSNNKNYKINYSNKQTNKEKY